MVVQTKEEKIIWSAIVKSISVHAEKQIQPTSILPNTKLIELFPTENGQDEQANRLGKVILNLYDYFNRIFRLHLQIDYEPRKEFQLFHDV
jgi:hypothetical protein